jgi:hypothetical protein
LKNKRIGKEIREIERRMSKEIIEKKMYIYGIFEKESGNCLYIGKSVSPEKRKCDHYRKKFKERKNGVEFKILKECPENKDFFWERLYILWYDNKLMENKAIRERMTGKPTIELDIEKEKYYLRDFGKKGDKRKYLKYWMDLAGYEIVNSKYKDYNGNRKYSVWKKKGIIKNIDEVFIGEDWSHISIDEAKAKLRKRYLAKQCLVNCAMQ